MVYFEWFADGMIMIVFSDGFVIVISTKMDVRSPTLVDATQLLKWIILNAINVMLRRNSEKKRSPDASSRSACLLPAILQR